MSPEIIQPPPPSPDRAHVELTDEDTGERVLAIESISGRELAEQRQHRLRNRLKPVRDVVARNKLLLFVAVILGLVLLRTLLSL